MYFTPTQVIPHPMTLLFFHVAITVWVTPCGIFSVWKDPEWSGAFPFHWIPLYVVSYWVIHKDWYPLKYLQKAKRSVDHEYLFAECLTWSYLCVESTRVDATGGDDQWRPTRHEVAEGRCEREEFAVNWYAVIAWQSRHSRHRCHRYFAFSFDLGRCWRETRRDYWKLSTLKCSAIIEERWHYQLWIKIQIIECR